jgi:hypothetical protein
MEIRKRRAKRVFEMKAGLDFYLEIERLQNT